MALHLLAEMPASRLVPDLISCNAVNSACEKGGEWQTALHFLAEMLAARLVPDLIIFNAGISACAKGQSLASESVSFCYNVIG